MEKTEISVPAPSSEAARLVFGVNDETRKLIERELPVALKLRDEAVIISGDSASAERAASLLADLLGVAQDSMKGGRALALADIKYLLRQANAGGEVVKGAAKKMMSDVLVTTERGKPIGPRTAMAKKNTWTLCAAAMRWCLPLARRERARPTWRSPPPLPRSKTSRSRA